MRHFSKVCFISSFETEKNSGSRSPILWIKTDSAQEKVHLPFTARENVEGRDKI